MLLTLFSFLVLLLILIFVHELGHFLAAKALGVKVERFSLGFPPRIWSRKIGETDYQIGWLPLGGYVKLFGEMPGEVIPEDQRAVSFTHKPLWVKALVVFAGPFFNIVFAVAVMWLLFMVVGIQHAAPVVGLIDENGPAYQAGLRLGDKVVRVNGQEISYFDQITDFPEQTAGQALTIEAERQGRILSFAVTPVQQETKTILGDPFTFWNLGLRPRSSPTVDRVFAGKPAEEAGLKSGDLIVSIDGRPIKDWAELVEVVQGPQEARGTSRPLDLRPLDFVVERDGQTLRFEIAPAAEPSLTIEGETVFTPMVGISNKPEIVVESLGPIRAAGYSFKDCWSSIELTYATLYRLLAVKISPKVMGGPILIAEAAGLKIREGLADFVALMVLISVNLAIINLVPLPVLDGGQLLFFLIEAIRRKPLSLRVREVTQLIGVCALVGLMILVFYNDISRIVTRKAGPPAAVQTESTE
ncbi:MAG: RIP metalloprotease RseP [Deltaproteobacteria bacterium]|jgi:regulator of sigma E protease|nr:RIP metalloprotease RseP [Deltaproteobacteria bacterium]